MYYKKSESNSYPVYISEDTHIIDNGKSSSVQPLYIGKLRDIEIENGQEDFWALNTAEDMFGDFFISMKSDADLPYYPHNQTMITWSGFDPAKFRFTKVDNGKFFILTTLLLIVFCQFYYSLDNNSYTWR